MSCLSTRSLSVKGTLSLTCKLSCMLRGWKIMHWFLGQRNQCTNLLPMYTYHSNTQIYKVVLLCISVRHGIDQAIMFCSFACVCTRDDYTDKLHGALNCWCTYLTILVQMVARSKVSCKNISNIVGYFSTLLKMT